MQIYKMKNIKLRVPLLALFLLTYPAFGQGKPSDSYESTVKQRIDAGLKFIQKKPWPDPTKNVNFADSMALLLLFKNENVAEANRLVLAFCGRDPLVRHFGKKVSRVRCESLFRIYLLESTRQRLSTEARKAIEDHAWELLTKYNREITRADAYKPFWEMNSSENHYLNDRRRYTLALWIVRMSKNYGPKTKLRGVAINEHCQAWEQFWINYFVDRSNYGVDVELAHPSSYGQCTNGVYYDLYDLTGSERLRKLAGNYITLFWAEVASEYDPRTGQRAGLATTRTPSYYGYNYWAKALLYCYGWNEIPYENKFLANVPFLTSSYRPPEILKAIGSDTKRGDYLSTSRRLGMEKVVETPWPHEAGREKQRKGMQIHRTFIFEKNGSSHVRRDIYFASDYALGTVIFSPEYDINNSITLAQSMGATFASDPKNIINVIGRGHYPRRATVGITGKGVSIISRDAKAEPGRGRFKSDGTSIFISNGSLWDNRMEDESGWFFTHDGSGYAAVKAADKGYQATTRAFIWPDRKLKEVEEKHGHHLESNDMWAPVIIQMGRKADYKSFEAFCDSVKSRPFAYEEGKLSYVSEMGDKYEYWSKLTQLPKINGETLNLNPSKTYDTPYLSKVHGESKATISYPGYEDVVLDFNENNPKTIK